MLGEEVKGCWYTLKAALVSAYAASSSSSSSSPSSAQLASTTAFTRRLYSLRSSLYNLAACKPRHETHASGVQPRPHQTGPRPYNTNRKAASAQGSPRSWRGSLGWGPIAATEWRSRWRSRRRWDSTDFAVCPSRCRHPHRLQGNRGAGKRWDKRCRTATKRCHLPSKQPQGPASRCALLGWNMRVVNLTTGALLG